MKIVVGLNHPKHAHIFRYVVEKLRKKGHDVTVLAVDKGETKYLANKFYGECIVLGKSGGSITTKFLKLINFERKTLTLFGNIKPDLAIGRAIPNLAHASALVGNDYVILEDTEIAGKLHAITVPFSKFVITPKNFLQDFGKKHIRFNGFFELAYLHPNYFKPDKSVLEEIGLPPGYVVFRTISWDAHHDLWLKGMKNCRKAVQELSKVTDVVVVGENTKDKFLRKYQARIPPEKVHSLLFYADLYFGEGGTMAAEAAILGTPAIHIESTVSGTPTGIFSGNFLELRDRYKLLEFYAKQDEALERAIQLLEDRKTKKIWKTRSKNLLSDKIDVSAWLVNFVEKMFCNSS